MFDHVKYDAISEEKQKALKAEIERLFTMVNGTLNSTPEKTLAIRKLQEFWMWVGTALKVEQQRRDQHEAILEQIREA